MTCIICNKSFNTNIKTEQCKCIYRCDICEEVPAKNHIKDNHYCDECIEYIEDYNIVHNGLDKTNTNTNYNNCNKCDMTIFMKEAGMNIYCEKCSVLIYDDKYSKYCELCEKYVPQQYKDCFMCNDCGPPNRPH